MLESQITYFGYGSLVNRDTRPRDETAFCARLHGWQRHWGHQAGSGDNTSCPLTIAPVTGKNTAAADAPMGIDGVIVTIPRRELAALDAREGGYERIELPAAQFELPADCTAQMISVYVSLPERRAPASAEFPVLQSYVDVVMAGYQRLFGESGLQAMLHSTVGWNLPRVNDRQQPRYPRAVPLDDATRYHFDRLLAAHQQQLNQEAGT